MFHGQVAESTPAPDEVRLLSRAGLVYLGSEWEAAYRLLLGLRAEEEGLLLVRDVNAVAIARLVARMGRRGVVVVSDVKRGWARIVIQKGLFSPVE